MFPVSTSPSLAVSYNYGANGNLISEISGSTTTGFTWDPADHLLKETSNGAVLGIYAYDGMGRRVEGIEASTTFYAYLGTDALHKKAIGGNSKDYVFAGGARMAKISGGVVDYYHTDAIGSVRMVTDSQGAITFSEVYQPFGQDNLVAGSETYRFTGKPVSQTTGLYYYGARWYDPSTGRFISPDPKHGKLSNPQSLNLYIYVVDDPTTLEDPTGLSWWNPFTWSQQQQAQAFTVAVIAVSIVVVVATAGAGTLLAAAAIGAAVGASASSATYTLTAGSKATLAGAMLNAATGALSGASEEVREL